MKFMRAVCWVWIVASTTLILFWSPVSVTRQADKSRPQVTRIEWIGPFGEPLAPRSNITKSSIDFSRMIAALLAANFLPAVILLRFKTIGEWLHRHKAIGESPDKAIGDWLDRHTGKLAIVARVLLFLFMLLFVIGAAMLSMFYGKAHRVPPTRSSLDEQSSARGASPSPAPPSEAKPTAEPAVTTQQYADLPPGVQVESTPQPTATPQPAPAARTSPAPPSEPARKPPSSDIDLSTAMLEPPRAVGSKARAMTARLLPWKTVPYGGFIHPTAFTPLLGRG